MTPEARIEQLKRMLAGIKNVPDFHLAKNGIDRKKLQKELSELEKQISNKK